MEHMIYGDLESEMNLEKSSGDLQSEKKKMKMILENSSGEEGFPCDLESEKKRMKMSLEKNSGEEQLIPSDSDVEIEDEKMNMTLKKSSEEQLIPPSDSDLEIEDDRSDMNLEKYSCDSETYSSDLELKEEDMEVYNKYCQQVVESGGFDIDRRPQLGPCILSPLKNLKEEDEEYKNLCSYSQLAINKFNEHNATSYENVKFVKAVYGLCAGFKYL